MKIIEKIPGRDKVLELSEREVTIIEAIVPPPFGDFKKFEETKWASDEIAVDIIKRLKNGIGLDEVEVESGFISKLMLLFKVSCEVLDPIEIDTVTGVTWIEAMKMYERLYKASHNALQ